MAGGKEADMPRKLKIVFLFLLLLLMANCDAMQKKALMQDRYPSYPENIRQAIEGEYVVEGMDHDQVYLALGSTTCKTTGYYQDKQVAIWSYDKRQQSPAETYAGTYDCLQANFKVYFDNGKVIGWGYR
jgi:outer membrane protein assembly factor BamE (lipoprotein component of BamABCDE complex)